MKLVITWFSIILLFGCANDPVSKIVSDRSVPFKGVHNACMNYAQELAPRLKAGGASDIRLIQYYWESRGRHNRHAVIYYRADGKQWIADNERIWPTDVIGSNDVELIQSFLEGSFTQPNIRIESDEPLN